MRKTSAELAAEAASIRAELTELSELDEPTDEQATRAETLLSEFEAKDAERAAAVEYEARIEAVRTAALESRNVMSGSFDAPNVIVRKDPFEGIEDLSPSQRLSDDTRERAITAISESRVRGVTDTAKENIVRTIENVPGAAMHVLAHSSPTYNSAFAEYLRVQGQNPDYSPEERQAIRAALNITTGNSGQFSLPTQFDPTLIHTGNAAINPIRSIARVVQGTQNVWNGVSVGNVATYWHAEAAALTDGSPTLAHPVVTAGHLTGYVTGSWEFFDDSAMVAQLPALIGEAMDYSESTAFVSGPGTSSPLGVITAISATAGCAVTATTRGASSFTSASSADVYAVVNAMPSRYEATASWVGNKKTFNIIRSMSPNGAGSLFWGTFSQSVTNPESQLLGSPVYNSSDVVATQTTGTIILVLGDFSQYLVYDRLGSTAEFVQNVVNSSGLPVGQRGLAIRKRVGGNVTDVNAFRFLLN